MQPKPKKGYTVSESGKPMKKSEQMMRANAMAKELTALAAQRAAKGGVKNMSQVPMKNAKKK